MSDDTEHLVVAGLLQNPARVVDCLEYDPDIFQTKSVKLLFKFALGYYNKRKQKNPLDLKLARSLLEASSAKSSASMLELVEEYEEFDDISDSEFIDALQNLVDVKKKAVLKDHSIEAMEAILDGDYDEARDLMGKGLLMTEDVGIKANRPIDIRVRSIAIEEKAQVYRISQAEEIQRFDIGFKKINDAVSVKRGELTILGGYVADGKTQVSKAMCYNANQNGANVLYVALEMSTREMLTLFVAQHAVSIDPVGIQYRDILDGCASQADLKLYHRALDDFCTENHEDVAEVKTQGGNLFVWAPTKPLTMNDLKMRVAAMNKDLGVDVLVVDYLELVRPSTNFGEYRLNVKGMAEAGKMMAREYALWCCMNHQISRRGRDDAEKRAPKHYLMRDLGESSGVERSADHIFWVFYDELLREEREAKIGIAKARKGRTITHGFHVMADYERSIVADLSDDYIDELK